MKYLDEDDRMRLVEARDAAHLEEIVEEILQSGLEFGWAKGYVSGYSNAMRRMSDEPDAPKTPNPYGGEE